MALIKTAAQQQKLRVAGQHLLEVFDLAKTLVKPGITPLQLDTDIRNAIEARGCRPSFLHYQGYPNTACIAVNDQVIHAIPNNVPLAEGDIVTIDLGLWLDEVCVDAARTYPVGKIAPEAQQLISLTEKALEAGSAAAMPGNHIGAISAAVEKVASDAGLGIVRHFTGHGVGTAVHEEPSIPNWGRVKDGPIIKAGMVLAIEPMFTNGGDEVGVLPDGWTVITVDGSLAAQVEHTVLVTPSGPEILV